MLVHLSKNKSGKFSFNPISVNLMTEVAKVAFALIVLLCLVTAVWTSWFWSFLVLWALVESVVILRRWEGLLYGT